MYNHLWSILTKILGVILILTGIVFGFIPILQGWILVLAGLLLLGVKKETILKWVGKLKFWKRKRN